MASPTAGEGMRPTTQPRPRAHLRWRAMTLFAAAGLMLAAGCSSSASSSGTGAATPSGSAGSGSANSDSVQTAARAALQAWIKGSQTAPPSTGPTAQKGKSIWVLSCGQAATACAYWTDSVVAAAKAIGWKVTLYDDKLVPTNGNTGLGDAVAAHASGAVVLGNDCPQNEQGLKAAKAAGMPVIGIDENDCNDSVFGGSGPSLLTQLKDTAALPTVDSFTRAAGALQADYLLANLGSSANVIELKSTDIISKSLVNQGFEAEYKKLCPACKLDQVPYTLNDMIGGQLKTDVQDALQSDSGANGMEVTADSDIALVVGPVVDSSSSAGKILVVGNEGLAANVQEALSGHWETAGIGEPFGWEGWAAVDALNRAFAGSPQVDEGIGLQLWSVKPTQVNLPPTGQNYTPAGIDYQSDYKKIWGVG